MEILSVEDTKKISIAYKKGCDFREIPYNPIDSLNLLMAINEIKKLNMLIDLILIGEVPIVWEKGKISIVDDTKYGIPLDKQKLI